ncbi:conserved hypothetical plastid protein (plastid) [Chondrus crispus]|uniref:Conserved hypothetical plastid protein n=1 Tax=Chondrus crispus TaxID=2769 RepID=M5DDJ4_CHOCR|nr:conserved hypothetical plastid protein [Chondrus crispus]CCP38189.1 conserved hypothetical plastid protein [Chondrus crispus]|eukprot:YP_007627442.1 conserved hypothetical plastid protein (plastid) [Chondrus crispus]
MNSLLKLLSNNIEGNWLSHQSIYYLQAKKIKINKFQKNIDRFVDQSLQNHSYICKYKNLSSREIIYNYVAENNPKSKSGILQKIYSSCIQTYKLSLNNTNCIEIKYLKNGIQYTEYTYIINKNLKISVIIIKKNNNYIAISFNSEIKIK